MAEDLKNLAKMVKIAEESHGGYAGKSLVEKLTDAADEAFRVYMTKEGAPQDDSDQGICQGLARALGIVRSSSEAEEYERMLDRYTGRRTPGVVVSRFDAP